MLTTIYKEYTNKREYDNRFRDITTGSNGVQLREAGKGWDQCAGVGRVVYLPSKVTRKLVPHNVQRPRPIMTAIRVENQRTGKLQT
jgi:hypothetical protein